MMVTGSSLVLAVLPVAVLVSVVTSVQKPAAGSCPTGQHRPPGLTSSHTGCCRPWNYTCPLNYSYSFCDEPGGWDKCRKCPEGYVQPFPSNADSPIQCYKNTDYCSEDKIALNTTARKCMCDLANNYYPLPLGCDFKLCPAGQHLLINGTCTTCLLGSYKNYTGPGQCLPWTNCEELGQFVFREGSSTEDVTCGLKQDPHPGSTPNTTRPPTPTNDTGTDIKVQHGQDNRYGIIGAFVVGGLILLLMLVLAFFLRKRACPPKASQDQLYLEMNLRGRTGRHQYEQVQSSDDDLDNSPTSPKIFQISSRSSRGGNRFTYPSSGTQNSGYGNLVISSDQENLADELTGLTVNLPDSPQYRLQRPTGVISPQPREEDDEGGLRTSGGSIPFDSFLRLTPLDSDGHHFVDQGLPPMELNESQQQQLRQSSDEPNSLTQVKSFATSR